mgnify:CR=1 FL=1
MKTAKNQTRRRVFHGKDVKFCVSPLFHNAKSSQTAPLRGSLTAVKLIYRLHAGRVFHRTGAAALVGQTLHAAGVGGLDGQGEDEPAPLALLALHPYLAAGEVDQHLADVQAETCAPGVETPGLVFFVEALEDVGQRLGADAWPEFQMETSTSGPASPPRSGWCRLPG